MASMIPESFASSFASNIAAAGLSKYSVPALMAQYQQSEYERMRMTAAQQAMMENRIRQELEMQICEQVKKNIKVEKRKDMTTNGRNYTVTWAGAPIYYTATYDGVFPTEKPEPKPKKIAKKALSFYEDLKAEIEGWLKGALDFAY